MPDTYAPARRTAPRRSHRRWLYFALPAALFICTLLSLASPAQALPKDDGGGGSSSCEPSLGVTGRLSIEGVHLDQKVVRARTVRIAATIFKLIEVRSNCSAAYYPLPAGAFAWQLVSQPADSGTQLGDTNTMSAAFTPDRAGNYTIRFSACPNGCTVGAKEVGTTAFDLTVEAVDALALPPATQPVLPSQTATKPSKIPDANEKCLGGGGVVDPQWVTVNQWTGAESYELLEGSVEKSHISRKDNPLNHDSQDHNVHVRPDPPFQHLLRGSQTLMEVEWERNHFPEVFRPTPGDRASVFGFWILDCGHDGPTEIHPPVAIAVHRPRAIPIDASATVSYASGDDVIPFFSSPVGTNVFVPGIVTDIYINQQAGEVTNNCSDTGLHQPGHYIVTPQGVLAVTGACIRSPHPLNRVFTFNIFLPPRPQLTTKGAVPLYTRIEPHPFGFSTGPEPQLTVLGTAPNLYIQVSIDLTNFTGRTYTRRILSGWALASPDNWGLRRWKVRLNNLDVHDDGDSFVRGDGDWRFWFNTNNGFSEWTKLFDCDGCVHGVESFGGRPWQTGDSSEVANDRSLGPDLLRFPQQTLWVHTSGFEADGLIDDDTGSVNDLPAQAAATRATRSYCDDQTISGCASYTLNYQILPGKPVGNATLSPAAQNVLDAYVVGPSNNPPCLICGETIAWHPQEAVLAPEDPPIELSNAVIFRVQPSLEISAMTDIPLTAFTRVITETQATRPEKVDTLMRTMRAHADAIFATPLRDEAMLDWRIIKEGIPPELWEEYFADLPLYQLNLPAVSNAP